jgi:hypothetical protein
LLSVIEGAPVVFGSAERSRAAGFELVSITLTGVIAALVKFSVAGT